MKYESFNLISAIALEVNKMFGVNVVLWRSAIELIKLEKQIKRNF